MAGTLSNATLTAMPTQNPCQKLEKYFSILTHKFPSLLPLTLAQIYCMQFPAPQKTEFAAAADRF